MPSSLTVADLKRLLHGSYGRTDNLLIVLASFAGPCQVREIRGRAGEAGYRIPKKWNISDSLGKSRGRAIRTPDGWEITDAGRTHLADLGIDGGFAGKKEVAIALRDVLPDVDANTRSFVEEAVSCYEAGFYRSAIVMSWVGAVAVLHDHIYAYHLPSFNTEAVRRNRKWKPARTTDDLGRMREAEFLDVICSLSIIGPNVKVELKSCLDRRNACGHPSSLRVAAHAAAHHLEALLLNVFARF